MAVKPSHYISRYLSIIVAAVVLANFLLMVFRKINAWLFWIVVVFSAVVAFWIIPGLRKMGV